jgi:hypothetical protein
MDEHKLTYDEKAVHFETWEHIHQVRKLITRMQAMLGERALEHDQSKIYSEEECATFAEFTPKLKDIEYGSDEYKACMKEMGPAIKHHQENNRHHPEYHEQPNQYYYGIEGMNLIDLLEMLCDWKAATLRTKNGDIRKSIGIQKERFGIDNQLTAILLNSIELFEED